jgi:hypothetical protein
MQHAMAAFTRFCKKFYKLGFRKDFHKHFAAYVTFDLHRSQISLSLARL